MIRSFTHFGFLVLVSLLVLYGCETTLDLQLNGVPKLTIICHMNPAGDDSQRVYVYATQSPSDSSSFYTPDNLVVDVTEEASQVTVRLNPTSDEGGDYFEFPEGFLHAGLTYSITAFAPGFDIVEATTVIPRPSTISNLIIKDLFIQQSDVHDFKQNVRYKVQFDINHFDDNHYYHLIFYNKYKNNDVKLVYPEPTDDQPFIKHHEYGVLLDSRNLTEGLPLTFEFRDFVVDDNDLVKVIVELRTINEAYYKYHSTLARQLILIQDPFAEPVTIYNNIEGGFGNFSGFTTSISSSDLPF